MEELRILLQKILNKDLQQIILSNSRNPEQIQKVKIRPVLIIVSGDEIQRNAGIS